MVDRTKYPQLNTNMDVKTKARLKSLARHDGRSVASFLEKQVNDLWYALPDAVRADLDADVTREVGA